MTLLFVCTGNTCRSPMAEALARERLDKSGKDDIMVESAGIAADGSPVSANAAAVLREWGLEIGGRLSRPLTAELCRQADVIAVMSPAHAAVVSERFGVPSGRIRVLGSGIPDPFGGDADLYRLTRDRLDAAVAELLASLPCA